MLDELTTFELALLVACGATVLWAVAGWAYDRVRVWLDADRRVGL